jgi:hypothetical protein
MRPFYLDAARTAKNFIIPLFRDKYENAASFLDATKTGKKLYSSAS